MLTVEVKAVWVKTTFSVDLLSVFVDLLLETTSSVLCFTLTALCFASTALCLTFDLTFIWPLAVFRWYRPLCCLWISWSLLYLRWWSLSWALSLSLSLIDWSFGDFDFEPNLRLKNGVDPADCANWHGCGVCVCVEPRLVRGDVGWGPDVVIRTTLDLRQLTLCIE